jgi:gas vesicle protein
MDREQEVIHKQMEETRSDLTDKLAALESQVGDTVQAATNAVETTTEAVSGTVETVKETVESVTEKLQDTVTGVTDSVQQAVEGVKESFDETVKSVTESFNLKLQCERHPWAVFGGAIAVGCVGSMLLGGSARESRPAARSRSGFLPSQPAAAETAAHGGVSHTPPERSQNSESSSGKSVSGAVGGFLWEQLGNFKGLALGTLMGVVRDVVSKALPENLKDRVSEEVDKLTKSLGGEPIQGSLLPENKEESEPSQDNGHEQQHHTDPWGMGKSETPAGRAGQPAMAGNRR